MKHTWRWFGPSDPISLNDIAQAGAKGIVSAMHHVPIGELWKNEDVVERRALIASAGLEWSVVESIPVHEAIKIGSTGAEHYTEVFVENLKTVAHHGVKTVCYNFMSVVDWTRTNLSKTMPTGAKALAFDMNEFAAFDICVLKRQDAQASYSAAIVSAASAMFDSWSDDDVNRIEKTIIAGLPGSELHHDRQSFLELLDAYAGVGPEQLRANLRKFVQEVAPVAKDLGVNLAVHPDDPPISLFGLPRVVSTPQDIDWLLDSSPEQEHGVTFCTGSFGAGSEKNLTEWFRKIAPRVHFMHLRNVSRAEDGSFFEAEHLGGDTDMVALIEAVLQEEHRRGTSIPMRPDHGHLFDRDAQIESNPGYSYLGRMRGLAELRGVEFALKNGRKS